MRHTPVLGGTAPRYAQRTAQKLSGFALRHVRSGGIPGAAWCLDVGCGNGFITTYLSDAFANVVGIDIERDRLDDFRRAVGDDRRFRVLWMSADTLAFPDAS